MGHNSIVMAVSTAASLEGVKRFNGQTFIVTGGANGIGFTIAQRLFTEGGGHGALFDVNEDACKAAVEKFAKMGFTASYKVVDVTKWASVKAAVDAVVAATGRIDVI